MKLHHNGVVCNKSKCGISRDLSAIEKSLLFFFFLFTSPRLIDMGKVYRQTNLENLEQAFNVAERDLGVTRLLDPEGTTNRPASVLTQ